MCLQRAPTWAAAWPSSVAAGTATAAAWAAVCTSPTYRKVCWARTASSARVWRWGAVRDSPPSTRGRVASPSLSLATAPPTRASFTRRSTWQPCGGCPSSFSVRTTRWVCPPTSWTSWRRTRWARCCLAHRATGTRCQVTAGSAWTAPTWLAVLEAGAVAPLCFRHTCLPSQVAVREAAAYCIGEARAGKGPSVVEALTFRHGSHNVGQNLPEATLSDDDREIRRKDPLFVLRGRLARLGGEESTLRAIDALTARAAAAVDAAETFARASPEPGLADLDAAVFSPPSFSPPRHAAAAAAAAPPQPPSGARERSFSEAIAEAHAVALRSDPRVVVMGEDIGEMGGVFQCTAGLTSEFGARRVIETPISEACIGGCAVGAAATGLVVPIVEVQIMDMVTLMMDNVVNQAAKWRLMLGGEAQRDAEGRSVSMPIVIRGPQGGGHRLSAQHSQSLEAWFTAVPGLKVVMPSTPHDAKGLLLAAVRDPNPVIFLEHKNLYQLPRSHVPDGDYEVPLGVASILREGTDVTLVATSNMVHEALKAAGRLAARKEQPVSVEVIDPRTLWPLDEATILDSVQRTSRLVIAHEAPRRGGWGGELLSVVQEKAFDYLDAPITIVAGRDCPLPYNAALEKACIPGAAQIAEACLAVVQRPGFDQ
mmetsp:Transcript_40999/g.135849  ORF Transcript_40999/g.135849 Transcript_40999/m.135849 type:complete len:652 (+) Transcript_40999:298-2253(+)